MPLTVDNMWTVVQQIGFPLEFSPAEGATEPLNFLVLVFA